MNLLRVTDNFSAWYLQVMGLFMRSRPGVTILVIIASLVARVTSLLAFFLPLKVILLAGSPGVPRYFPFIDPADKISWIIGLAVGAFVCYGLTLILDAWTDRMSIRASSDIIEEANALAVLRKQNITAKDYYVGFCQLGVDLLFVSLGFLLLAFLNTWLFLVMMGLVIGQYFFAFRVMAGDDDLNPGKIKAYVIGDLKNFLKILASVNFLTAFVVILVPFLKGVGGNILIALISIIFLRQALGSLVDMAYNAVRLFKDRLKINALIFREHQLESKPELRRNMVLRELFSKTKRQQTSVEALLAAKVIEKGSEVDVCWADSFMAPVGTLLIDAKGVGGASNTYFQQQIFSERDEHRIDNEEFLFQHIARSRLKAPEISTRFTHGAFQCVIYPYGLGQTIDKKDWSAWRLRLLENSWTCMPPPKLIEDYNASRPLLHQRLNTEKIGRVEVGADSTAEERILQSFGEALPALQARLKNLPLYVHNPDLKPGTTVYVNEDDVAVMTWGRWSLEPLGAGPGDLGNEAALIKFLPRLKEMRRDVPDSLSAEDIKLAGICCKLEAHINRQEYKAALGIMARIIDQSILDKG